MESELKHLGCEDILDTRGNAWVLEIFVYIEIAEEVKMRVSVEISYLRSIQLKLGHFTDSID